MKEETIKSLMNGLPENPSPDMVEWRLKSAYSHAITHVMYFINAERKGKEFKESMALGDLFTKVYKLDNP